MVQVTVSDPFTLQCDTVGNYEYECLFALVMLISMMKMDNEN